MQRTNSEWVQDLKSSGLEKEIALSDLREQIIKVLPHGLSQWINASSPHFDQLIEETAQESLLRVLDRLDSFEGRSQFMTWVYTISVRIALTELRRKRWKNVSLEMMVTQDDQDLSETMFRDEKPGPMVMAEQNEMINQLNSMMEEELTDYQRKALQYVGIMEMPMDQAAELLGTNRNALYKLLHDARIRLKRRLARDGLSAQEFLEAFAKQ